MCVLCAHQANLNANATSNSVGNASASGFDSLIAPWDPASGSREFVGVYSDLNPSSAEWEIWNDTLESLDALIDKDFTYTSVFSASITIDHVFLGWNGVLANADYFDFNVNNQRFDIAMNVSPISEVAAFLDYDYEEYYAAIAAHELGHTLGLKHPFDDLGDGFPANESLDATDTIMAYGFSGGGFTGLDIAALIEVNGIEDDWVNSEAPVHRFFNTISGGHFFTSDTGEAEFVATQLFDVFTYEGTGFYAGGSNAANDDAVYRFYNPTAGGHFFTIDEGERDFVLTQLSGQYVYEGVGFLASTESNAASSAVYRFYNQSSGGHFFTSDAGERDFVIEQLSSTFTYEGVGFYA